MRRNNAKTRIKITEKMTVTQEETLEISDGVSSQLPPARQRRQESGGNPCRRGLPKGKLPQKRQQQTQRPQRKRKPLPPPKPEPVRKLVGSISGETLKALTAHQAKPKARIIPDLFFSLVYKQQQQTGNRKALTSKKAKALPAPKRKRRE